MADIVEERADRAPAIDDNVRVQDGEDQGQAQGKPTTGGANATDTTASVLGKRKGRRTTTSFSKPDTTMVLQYNDKGQPTGKWCKNYSTNLGICARKVNILLTTMQITRELMQTFWDDTKASVYNLVLYLIA